MESHRETILSWVGNGLSLGAIATTMLGLTPAVAAIVAIIWYSIQIYESATVQKWFAKRRLRRLARLKAEVLMLETKIVPLPPDVDELG